MIKLYRKNGDRHEYWEAWVSEGAVTIHHGQVGERGEDRTVTADTKELGEAVIEREAGPLLAAGYRAIPPSDHDVIVVQYSIESMGTAKDLKKRHKVESLLNNEIGWLGAGKVDGGDIGSGTMNIFILVVDGPIVAPKVVEILRSARVLSGAVVATADKDHEYRVVYPPDHNRKFTV